MEWTVWVPPLIGVVLGAVVTGGWQTFNDSRKTRGDLRMRRIEATRDFIVLYHEAVLAWQYEADVRSGEEASPAWGMDHQTLLAKAIELTVRLDAARALLLLMDDSEPMDDLTESLTDMLREDVGLRGSAWGTRSRATTRELIEHARRR